MYEKLRGIVFHVLKYSDKNSIAHIFTDAHGKMSFLVPQGNTRSARMRNALFQPLSILEFEANIIPGKELYTLKDTQALHQLPYIYSDPAKSAIAMFISELLMRSIQETECNISLWQFIEQSVISLDSLNRGVANFHIYFIYHLSAFLGIQPDVGTYNDGYWFDMTNGIFTATCPLHLHLHQHQHRLAPNEAKVLYLISRMSMHNLHLFKFTQGQRNQFIDAALTYFRLHNAIVGIMKTPDILRHLFA